MSAQKYREGEEWSAGDRLNRPDDQRKNRPTECKKANQKLA